MKNKKIIEEINYAAKIAHTILTTYGGSVDINITNINKYDFKVNPDGETLIVADKEGEFHHHHNERIEKKIGDNYVTSNRVDTNIFFIYILIVE